MAIKPSSKTNLEKLFGLIEQEIDGSKIKWRRENLRVSGKDLGIVEEGCSTAFPIKILKMPFRDYTLVSTACPYGINKDNYYHLLLNRQDLKFRYRLEIRDKSGKNLLLAIDGTSHAFKRFSRKLKRLHNLCEDAYFIYRNVGGPLERGEEAAGKVLSGVA